MNYTENVLNQLINNFDISYILVVNVATYLSIKCVDKLNGDKDVLSWQKRLILISCVTIISFIYYINGYDNFIKLVNSSILTPIAWSWVLKPICKKLNIDYKDVSKYLD